MILAKKLDIFIIVYLDDILIYTKDQGQLYVEAVQWVLDQLQKYFLFANLKKYQFHQDEVCFLGYVVFSKEISMEVEQIELVRKWPKPKSVRDIQVFLDFANFYRWFIQDFGKIATSLTSMLKTTGSPKEPASSKNNGSRPASGKNDGSRPASSKNDGSRPASGMNNGNGKVDRFGSDGVEQVRKSGKSKKLSKWGKFKGEKSKKPPKSENSPNFDVKDSGPSFWTPKARSAFNCLWLTFTKAPILWHFDPECHIRIETDASGYAISSVLSQLAFETSSNKVVTKFNLGQWYLVAFFSRKMISAKTWYKTHDGEFLAIVEAFKTWHHYLEFCKHEILVLINYNNLRYFIDTKSLSSRQVRWAKVLS